MYYSIDAPETADFGSVFNMVVARRDAAKGWSGASLNAPVHGPTASFFASITQTVSSDLMSTLTTSDQSPDGSPSPPGMNLWVTHTDGTFGRVTNLGNPFVKEAETYQGFEAFSTYYAFDSVFFKPNLAQLPGDPAPGTSTYWWEDGTLRLLGVMPGGAVTTGGSYVAGGVLPPVSKDGRWVLFRVDNDPGLLLRSATTPTVDVTVSQRTVEPDPNPTGSSGVVGVTPDGSKVLFLSHSELTNDAYTGRSAGLATDAGNDIYSYDIATGKLEDLTVSTNPADAATGANVQSIVGSTVDGSSIYFTATGVLAPGATPGQPSLYVLRGEHIEFVANAAVVPSTVRVSQDGTAIAFNSIASLTGYDNTDPVTGVPHSMAFLLGPSHRIECVSCRPDGSRPTADAELAGGSTYVTGGTSATVSNNGDHVFFQTSDAVLPQASSGLAQVYEYSHGKVSALSRPDAPTRAYFLDASASGDNAFIATHDPLIPNKNSGDFLVYDARVDGGFAQPTRPSCELDACEGPATAPPVLPIAASVTFAVAPNNRDGNAGPPPGRVSVSKSLSVKGTRAAIRVKVPGKGRLTASGSGLRAASLNATGAETVTLKVSLTAAATRALKKHRTFRARAKVTYVDADGNPSTATVALRFNATTTKKVS
jgi:hypothetical protein